MPKTGTRTTRNTRSSSPGALRITSGHLQAFVEHAPYIIQLFDAQGHSLYANKAYYSSWPATPPPEWTIFDDPHLATIGLRPAFDRLRGGETIELLDVWLNLSRYGGSDCDRCFSATMFPFRDRAGRIYQYALLGHDITERKRVERRQEEERRRAEDSLRLNAERVCALLALNQMIDAELRQITDFALEEGVRLTRSRIGYLAFLNDEETVLTMHSWSRQAMRQCAIEDKPISYVVSETGLWGEAVRQRRPVITNDYAAPNSLRKGYPAGHVPVRRHMNVPVFVGQHIVLVAGVGNKDEEYDQEDVQQLTLLMEGMWRLIERRRAAEEREHLRAQLEQAQKMESIGRLAGGVAHDFNNMLTAILGYADMALERLNPSQPLYQDLHEIRSAAQRSADLTRQLLAFARKQTVAPRVLDLNATVEGMLNMLRRLIGEDIETAWRPAASLPPVRVDPSQIDQLLANLCANARDAIEDTGKVTIETGCANVDAAHCANHPGFTPGEYVLLAVSDTGCGMDGETRSRLFEPFFTTKERGRGTGLGLATVYGIVKQNNGFIDVSSEPGLGTTITIYLPRNGARSAAAPAHAAAHPPERGQETILVVEDEPMNLRLTARILERHGYTVLPAGTPGEALRLAREHPGPIHLLLSDVVMPEMNGRELARNLLALRPGLRRVFTSGYTGEVIAHRGVVEEGMHFIQKPFTSTVLAAKVREALDGE